MIIHDTSSWAILYWLHVELQGSLHSPLCIAYLLTLRCPQPVFERRAGRYTSSYEKACGLLQVLVAFSSIPTAFCMPPSSR